MRVTEEVQQLNFLPWQRVIINKGNYDMEYIVCEDPYNESELNPKNPFYFDYYVFGLYEGEYSAGINNVH